MVNRELTSEQFSEKALKDENILATVPKVKAKLEPEYETRFPEEQALPGGY